MLFMGSHPRTKSPYMGLSENVVYPIVPNGFADHYPGFKWLFHWEYTIFSGPNPYKYIMVYGKSPCY